MDPLLVRSVSLSVHLRGSTSDDLCKLFVPLHTGLGVWSPPQSSPLHPRHRARTPVGYLRSTYYTLGDLQDGPDHTSVPRHRRYPTPLPSSVSPRYRFGGFCRRPRLVVLRLVVPHKNDSYHTFRGRPSSYWVYSGVPVERSDRSLVLVEGL